LLPPALDPLRLGDVVRADRFNFQQRPHRVVEADLTSEAVSAPAQRFLLDLGNDRGVFTMCQSWCPAGRASPHSMGIAESGNMMQQHDEMIESAVIVVRHDLPINCAIEFFQISNPKR